MDQGLILTDYRGMITFIDKVAAELLKISITEAIGHKLTEVFQETRALEVFTTGDCLSCEHILGEGVKVLTHYLPITEKGQLTSVAVCFGISSSENELETLKNLSDLYESILRELPLGMAVVNQQGRLVMVNKQYSQFLGVNDDDILGRPIREVASFTRLNKVMASGEAFFDTGIQHQGRNFFLSEVPIKNGSQIMGGLSKLLAKEGLEDKDWRDLVDRFQLLEGKLMFYKEELKELRRSRSPFEEIIGESSEMKKLKQLAQRVTKGDANVLITGESGTGKGLFAQAIHNASSRNGEPFIKINCAAIPENLLESELFGYEEGAFSGAVRGGKPGKFELANGGTIFLDEIGDMPLAMQAKILRVLQDKTFERVGGNKTLTVDVRVIAATNRDLEHLLAEKEFRLDLYYRLAVINMHIPPLRERPDDILPLVGEIINKLSIKYAQTVVGIDSEVKQLFLSQAWPGNVRELENVIEHAFNFLEAGEEVIEVIHLSGMFLKQRSKDKGLELNDVISQAEADAIRQALQLTKGNKQEAARILGIHPSGLYQKLKKYSLAE